MSSREIAELTSKEHKNVIRDIRNMLEALKKDRLSFERTYKDGVGPGSREIAEITGKEHRNVMADVRKMLAELHGENGVLNFQQSYINEQNKEQPCFSLPKRESLILVSGYDIPLRHRVVTRLMQWGLENGIRIPEMTELIDWMLRLEKTRGPVGMVKLITGSHDGEENLTAEDLLTEETPLDAAAVLLENLIMNYRAGL